MKNIQKLFLVFLSRSRQNKVGEETVGKFCRLNRVAKVDRKLPCPYVVERFKKWRLKTTQRKQQ